MPRGGRAAAESSTRLDVDRMILDFLIHMNNNALFEDYENRTSRSKRVSYVPGEKTYKQLALSESFAGIFSRNFPNERVEQVSSFRAKLLHFTLLLSQRTIPGFEVGELQSLKSLRTSASRRTGCLSPSRVSGPLHKHHLNQLPIGVEFRAHYVDVLRKNGATEIHPSLLDLQPVFFKLSAFRSVLDGDNASIEQDWMNLAGQFMVQTVIEQFLVLGSDDTDVLKDALSWGWKGDRNIESVYRHQNEQQAAEWENVRSRWISLLKPPSKSTPLAHHLLNVAAAYPLHQFEAHLMNFLETLNNAVSPPILSQLDQGHMEGLSTDEFQDLLRNAQVVL